jgi:cytochrome P450
MSWTDLHVPSVFRLWRGDGRVRHNGGMTGKTAIDATLHPPRWAPSMLRWHHTQMSWLASWKLAVQVLPRWNDRTVIDYYATQLPGRDDIIVARMPFARFVIIRSPELARHVLVSNQDNYCKGAEYDLLAVAFGRGLVTELDDARWARNRRLVQPIFAKRNLDRFVGPMTQAACDAVERFRRIDAAGAPVDVTEEMNRLTLDIIARTMFGTDLSGPMAAVTLSRLIPYFGIGFVTNTSRPLRALSTLLRRYGPDSKQDSYFRLPMRIMRVSSWVIAPRAVRDLRHIERVVDQLIVDHRTGAITRNDNLLGLLIEARDPETGHGYSDLEIHDELMTFFGAGMETTATALAWAWKLLAEHRAVRDRLHDELDRVLGGRLPTADDVDRLPWTKAVVAETRRVYAPITGLARVAKNDDLLGDFPIKAGTTLTIFLHGLHHNSRVWDRPDVFDPTRFLDENLGPAQRHAALPFGAGKRMCVASGFATMEAVLVLATIAQRVDLDRIGNEPIKRQISFTGGPDGPIPMQPTFREQRRVATI